MSIKQTDILIIGGGIAGLTLACLLGGVGIDVHLVEPYPPGPLKDAKPSGRTVALMENSLNIIKATGAWEAISEHSGALKAMRIIDSSMPGRETLQSDFPASDIGQEQFGFNIPNAYLRASLYERAKASKNITLHSGKFLSALECNDSAATATLDDGTQISARLLVAADGRTSKTRELLGITAKENKYGQNAITCVINHSKAHENISTEFHRPAGPLALVPLPGNQSSVVWVEKESRAQEIIKLKKSDFTQCLQDAMSNHLGGITLEIGPEMWPLVSIQAESLTAPRTAIVAEAAHVMSPITAQGLNLSLRDIAALAELVTDAMRVGLDPGTQTLLNRYEKRRRLDIKSRVFGVDNMNKVVSNDIPAIKGLRRAGFKAMQSLPPLKRFATEQALATPVDKSRLAKGEAL